jgi:DMSO/TMAO reductase YedYZ molybdopterin-dependent catalytic subunit
MRRQARYVAVALVLAICCLGCSKGCSKGTKGDATRLRAVEVAEYKGEKLGSLRDFRENSIKGPQEINIGTYRLEVAGLVDTPLLLTYDEVLAYPKYSKVVVLNCVEGWSVKILWEGILVKDILARAGVKPQGNTVIFYAPDGYTTSLPLDYIMGRNIMMAYSMNGATLPVERGFPFELVAEDKLGYKWIRWITRIEVSDNPDYKGYWESRGYDNDAGL